MSGDATMNLDLLRQILARLDGLEQKVDAKLMDTRPIWERALAEIVATRAELSEARAELSETRSELSETRSELAETRAELAETRAELAETRTELAEFRTSVEGRLDKLEVELAEFRHESNANLHSLDRQIMVVAKEFVHLRSDQHYLEDRVEAIEQALKPKA
jgi:chromosome segregation ATPase